MNIYSYVYMIDKMKSQKPPVEQLESEEDVSQLADLFRLMGDTSRLRIIHVCLHSPISVSDIAKKLASSRQPPIYYWPSRSC